MTRENKYVILDLIMELSDKFVSDMRSYILTLLADNKRLTRERDAAIADLREAIAIVCDDECKFCKHDNFPECVICRAGIEDKWEWRGVRETVNE